MKIKLLPIIAMLGAALATTAQITINRSDFGNLAGKQVVRANDSTNLNLLSPGSAGANQNWDLTGIGNDYKDTLSFINSTGTYFTNSFPKATLATNQQGMVVYLYDNNSVLEMLGICGVFMAPDTSIVPFTPPQKQMTFPFTYNTTFSGQTKRVAKLPYSSVPMVDSVKLVGHISYTSLIDGWGNVTTPSGTFPSLRRKYTSYETDSMFVHTQWLGWQPYGTPTIDTTIEYSWVSQHIPFIADIVTSWNGSVKSANYMLSTTIGFITPSTNTVTIDTSANISVASNVIWTAKSNETWLTVSPDTATQDTATLTFTATANPYITVRTATVTVSAAGVESKTILVTQAGDTTLTVSTNTASVAKDKNSSATVTVSSNTTWTATSNETWLTVSPDTATQDAVTLTFTATANPNSTTRTATVSVSASGVASQTIIVTQTAATPVTTLSVTSANIAATDGSTTIVTVIANTTWSASSSDSWLTVGQSATSGNGIITLTATANPINVARIATVTITNASGSQTITVMQAAGTGTGFATVDEADVVIYPNPATSSFSINTQSLTKVQIYTVSGTLVLSKQVNGKESIPTNNLTKGMYVVKIITDNAVMTKTLIVE